MRGCVGVAALTRPAESKACKTRKDVAAEASLLSWESDLRAIGGMPATSRAGCCALSGVLARRAGPEDTCALS